MKKLLFTAFVIAALLVVGCKNPVEGDLVAPTVSATSPADLSVDVAIGANVTATFSEEMDAATMIAANFTLFQGLTPVAGVVSYEGSIATFNPTADLAYSSVYTATVTTSAADLAGNPLAANKVWSFTTAAEVDATAPTVSATSPADLAVDTAVGGNVTATFSEEMDAATMIAANFTLFQGLTPIAGVVSYASNVVTFNPTAELSYNTIYTATVSTDATDVVGNPLAADKVWSFTTMAEPDTTAPTVSSTSPADLAVDVAIGTNVTATFSEEMDAATMIAANFTLFQGLTPIVGAVSYVGNVATFNPTANLAYSSIYTATVSTDAADVAGNPLAAVKVWSFTTMAEPDLVAPTVSSTSPANLAVDVAIGSNVTATFSEEMDAATMIAANFTLFQGSTPIAGAVNYGSSVATFNPTADLAYSTIYTATVSTDATDVAGNPLAANRIWSFTTAAAPDVTAPTVSSTSPAHLAVSVAVGSNVTATFSEAMNSATIIGANFTLFQGSNSVAGAVSYSSGVATFNPTADLVYSTVYTATVTTAATDVAGNALAANKVWTFTTAVAPDVTAPTVSSTSPADLAVDIAIGGNVTATFSEAMNASTIIAANFTLFQGLTPIAGVVTYASNVATFNPDSDLANDLVYTATVTTAATDVAGNPLASAKIWTFTTIAAEPAGPSAVSLGTAGNYVILAKTAISTVPTSAITGDIAVSPAAASFITGFSLVDDASNVFATATQVIGRVYAADNAPPTPLNLTTAVTDMEAAYTDAAGRVTPDFLDLGAGAIGGLVLVPGLYKWNTTVTIGSNVTLNGGANDVWIFQISGGITQASATSVMLTGGAQAHNIFWQSAQNVVLGTTAHMEGIVLCMTAINLGTGASINGRLLAQTAVAVDGSTVVEPTM